MWRNGRLYILAAREWIVGRVDHRGVDVSELILAGRMSSEWILAGAGWMSSKPTLEIK
jgi:hypothetical protein